MQPVQQKELVNGNLAGNVMEESKSLTKKNFKGLDLAEEGYPKKAEANNAFPIGCSNTGTDRSSSYEAVLKYGGAVLPKRGCNG